jgi:hypothetical protein
MATGEANDPLAGSLARNSVKLPRAEAPGISG